MITMIENFLNAGIHQPFSCWQWYVAGFISSILTLLLSLFDDADDDFIKYSCGLSFVFGTPSLFLSCMVLGLYLALAMCKLAGTIIVNTPSFIIEVIKIVIYMIKPKEKKKAKFSPSATNKEPLSLQVIETKPPLQMTEKEKLPSNVIYLNFSQVRKSS